MIMLKTLCNLLKLSKNSIEPYIRDEKLFSKLSLDKKKDFVLKYILIREDINEKKDAVMLERIYEILKIWISLKIILVNIYPYEKIDTQKSNLSFLYIIFKNHKTVIQLSIFNYILSTFHLWLS